MIVLLALPAFPAGADMIGPARVVDGDTIDIAGRRIDLRGIDAPELDQTCLSSKGQPYKCGILAAKALAAMVARRTLTCTEVAPGGEGNPAAVCHLGWWVTVNEQMVIDGWAMAGPLHGQPYVRAEKFARARRQGLWRGSYEPPWEWRRREDTPR